MSVFSYVNSISKMLYEMKPLVILSALLCICAALPTSRVVGGFDAKNGSAPYMASLKDQGFSHFCGASVLNNRWLLTAAHCVDTHRQRFVHVGTNDLHIGGEVYFVSAVVMHESYIGVAPEYSDDIALVKVERDIVFGKTVQPITLHRGFLEGGEDLKVTGWGMTDRDVPVLSSLLQELHVKALNNSDCAVKAHQPVTTQVCTELAKEHGVCSGDSGGPLVLDGELVGVASFVVENCALGYPDFFTRVSLYLDWVEKHIKN